MSFAPILRFAIAGLRDGGPAGALCADSDEALAVDGGALLVSEVVCSALVTADVERAPELARVVKVYNELAEADGFPAANHFIMTHYIDGEHSIGFLFSAKSFSFPNYTNSRSFSGAAKAEVRK